MLSTNKQTITDISVTLYGQSTIDDEVVAQYSAGVDANNGRLTITTTIFNQDKYFGQCQSDETEFEEEVRDAQKQVMDRQEEIIGLFKEDEPEDEPDDEPDDEPEDDDKTGAGNEETINP